MTYEKSELSIARIFTGLLLGMVFCTAQAERLSLSGLKNDIDAVDARVDDNAAAIATRQNRVDGICPVGEAMVAVNDDGSVVCDVTQPAADSIGSSNIIDGSITPADLAETEHIMAIPPVAFIDALGGPVNTSFGRGGAYRTTNDSGAMVAPVNLPHGAVITEVAAWVLDNDTADLSISLAQRGFTIPGVNPLVDLTSSGALDSFVELNSGPLNISVNNSNRSYRLRLFASPWPGNSSLRINGVRIKYVH